MMVAHRDFYFSKIWKREFSQDKMWVCWKFWLPWLFPHTQFLKMLYDLIIASMELCFQTDSSISLDDFSLGWRKPILSCLIVRFFFLCCLLPAGCCGSLSLSLIFLCLVWRCLRLWRKALYPYYLLLAYNRSLSCPALDTQFHKCLSLYMHKSTTVTASDKKNYTFLAHFSWHCVVLSI